MIDGIFMERVKITKTVVLSAMLALFAILVFAVPSYAQEYTVGDGSGDITDELRNTMRLANEDEPGEILYVNIRPGTYTIRKNIYIYSDTVLNAEDCTFNFAYKGTMLKSAHVHDGIRCRADEGAGECEIGGYNQAHNISVNGGTWDASGAGSSTNTQCIMFRHADNISISNVTAKGSTNHAFNLSGVNNATITNCKFTAPTKYTGKDSHFWGEGCAPGDATRFNSMEAIHLDFTSRSGEPNGKPLDNTPCKNISVSNCLFDGVFSGVGTHHANDNKKKRAANITVKDCTFRNLSSSPDNKITYGRAFSFYTADKVVFTNNKVEGVYNVVLLDDVSNVQVYNNMGVKRIKGNAFYVRNNCNGFIQNNSVSDTAQTGVYVDKSPVTVYNNKISDTKTHGIFVINGNANTKINCNTIKNTNKTGVYILNGTTRVFQNNISSTKEQGIFANHAGPAVIDKNKVSSSKKEGIYVYKSDSVMVKGNTVNKIKANSIGAMDSKTVKIHSNTVSNGSKNGILVFASNSKERVSADIRNNTIKNNKGLGVLIQNGFNNNICRNTILANGKNGIQVQGHSKKAGKKAPSVQVRNNTVKSSGGMGIALIDTRNSVVYKNNVLENKRNGIQIDGSQTTNVGTTVANNNTKGNRGWKDIYITSRCKGTKVQFNVCPKKGRILIRDMGAVNKGNHYEKAKSIKSAKITGIKNRRYTGKAQYQPDIVVKVNGKKLKKGTHYKLTYEKNVKKGSARVYIIGQGNYKDYVARSFKIN